MQELREAFITSTQSYMEGSVNLFEQCFITDEISKARLQITALGLYEAEINGAKVGKQLFAPGYTYYHRNLHYQEYDITNMLQQGENVFRVFLAQGWYCGRFTHENKIQIYGDKSSVSWILTITENTGKSRVFKSSDIASDFLTNGVFDGQVRELVSPYTYAGFYDGEVYFAEGNAIDEAPVYSISGNYKPQIFTGQLPEIIEKHDVAVKLQEEIEIAEVIKYDDRTIIDFGQNFAGVISIDPNKLDGNEIKIRHAELLNSDGSLYTANLRKARAELVYHKGSEMKIYTPRFTYMGFRYIEITGADYQDGLITAHAIYDSMARTGDFDCGHDQVNRLFQNQIWGQKSNYIEVPTDCPQRDERMGYTGDGQVFAWTGSYNFNTENFWSKFLKDIRYSQMDNSEGYVAPTIPAEGPGGIGFLNMLGWGNAVTIIPEMLEWQYGTSKHLEAQYESMKQFVECEINHMEGKNLWLGANLGDWLMMGKDIAYMARSNGPVSNSFIVNDLRIISEYARRTGRVEDAHKYETQLEATRNAYISAFVENDGSMRDDYQGAYIMALRYVLPDGDLKKHVYDKLITHLKEEGIQTGFFSTEFLLPLLAENGDSRLAYDLLLSKDCPGWIYQIERGATTMWERWDSILPDGSVNESKMSNDNMVSFNHYAFGSVGRFFYQNILGIKPLEHGYKKVQLKPCPDQRLGYAAGSYDSAAGLIKSSWHYAEDHVRFEFETPVDAIIYLPDESMHEVGPGAYKYQIAL